MKRALALMLLAAPPAALSALAQEAPTQAPTRADLAAAAAAGRPVPTAPAASVPAGAILGVYDAASGKFSAAAVEPQAIGQGKIIWQPRFHFTGDAADYPTIRCQVTVYSGSAATNNYLSASGSMDYDSIGAPPAINLVFNYDTSLKNNPLRIYAQCSAYDSNGLGHSWAKTKTDNADAGTIRYTAQVNL